MEYGLKLNNLLKEAKQGIQYKDMGKACKLFTKLGMFPVYLITLIYIGCFYMLNFIYKGIQAPIKFLHEIVTKERTEVKHATQAVIYFLAFPTIFLCYCIISILTLTFYFNWFVVMSLVYISSLGGVRWQPYLTDATFDKELEYETKPGKKGKKFYATQLFILDIFIAIACIALLFTPSSFENMITTYKALYVNAALLAFTWFIVNPLLFRKKVKEPASPVDEKTEAPVVEK